MKRDPLIPMSLLALCISGTWTTPANAQGGRAGHYFTRWQDSPWSAIEWRTRCDGGPVGVNGGPINWTVQFHNRTKGPITFDYRLSNAEAETHGQVPVAARTTLKPKGVLEKPVTLRTDSCAETITLVMSRVRLGVDADSVPYAPPDRR